MKEVFKNVNGFESRYQVSNFGRVISLNYNKTGKTRELKYYDTNRGYLRVTLQSGKEIQKFSVHRLVALHFCEGYFDDAVVNHIDENKHNNRADNLEWVTQKKNINSGNAILKRAISQSKAVEAYDNQGNFVMKFRSTQEAERHGYCSSAVVKCCKGKLKHYKGLVWKYA